MPVQFVLLGFLVYFWTNWLFPVGKTRILALVPGTRHINMQDSYPFSSKRDAGGSRRRDDRRALTTTTSRIHRCICSIFILHFYFQVKQLACHVIWFGNLNFIYIDLLTIRNLNDESLLLHK